MKSVHDNKVENYITMVKASLQIILSPFLMSDLYNSGHFYN